MAYTNSPLVVYTNLSPNHSGQRTHSIDRITPHCVVGQLSAESICGCFISPSRQASCNYGIGKDGRVSLCVEEKNRSWCSSSAANDQRAITIECASDLTHPYAMNSAVYTSLIKLCTDICKRNGKTKLLWLGDKNKTLNYAPASDEMVLTVHRWYANKACPGDWLYSRLSDLAAKVTAALGTPVESTGLQAASLKDMESAEVVTKVATLFTANQKQSGILASVSMAQFILESGYGKSELAQNANNCFGMKLPAGLATAVSADNLIAALGPAAHDQRNNNTAFPDAVHQLIHLHILADMERMVGKGVQQRRGNVQFQAIRHD